MIFSDIARYYCYHMIICPSVSPSVRPSVCPACRPPSSNLPSSPPTLLNEQTYIHDTQKCNFSVNFSRNWLNFFSFFTTYIKRVLSSDFQITLKNGNIDGGGGECYFILTILKIVCYFSYPSTSTLLMLESPTLYA